VRRQNHWFSWALKQVEKPSFPAKSLVTHMFSLEDAAKAFELAAGYKDGVVKTVIKCKPGGSAVQPGLVPFGNDVFNQIRHPVSILSGTQA
jgi:hypothetical protein